MALHFNHDGETILKTYAHFFMETEQDLIQEFDEVIDLRIFTIFDIELP